jgi:hypothetical protein
MTNIVDNNQAIQIEETDYKSPTSEGMLQKIGGTINYLRTTIASALATIASFPGGNIQVGTIDGDRMIDNTITGAKFLDDSITTIKIQDNSVTRTKVPVLTRDTGVTVDSATSYLHRSNSSSTCTLTNVRSGLCSLSVIFEMSVESITPTEYAEASCSITSDLLSRTIYVSLYDVITKTRNKSISILIPCSSLSNVAVSFSGTVKEVIMAEVK